MVLEYTTVFFWIFEGNHDGNVEYYKFKCHVIITELFLQEYLVLLVCQQTLFLLVTDDMRFGLSDVNACDSASEYEFYISDLSVLWLFQLNTRITK